MTKTYFRATGLCYGTDAEQLIARRTAGRLGGNPSIGFTAVECITRDNGNITRDFLTYAEAAMHGSLQSIEADRPEFSGVALNAPRIMGIVNVTPDSFSDGGKQNTSEDGLRLAADGAHILDVGGESTRPGSDAVPLDDELARVIPVIKPLSAAGHVVSVDTRKSAVMREAVKAGARIINDVSALQHDPGSLRVVAELGCPVVLMHAQGDPRTMQLNPHYDDVALDVYDYLEARIEACVAAGISRSRIAVDPGIGFGKTFRHNIELLNQIALFHGLGVAVLVGLSRKGFVGALTGEKVAGKRVHGSVGGAVHVALHGVHILRVHDVKATTEALAVAMASADPRSVEF
jgi:dihydropteroate synthase